MSDIVTPEQLGNIIFTLAFSSSMAYMWQVSEKFVIFFVALFLYAMKLQLNKLNT